MLGGGRINFAPSVSAVSSAEGAPTYEVLYVSERLLEWEREKHGMQAR